jgi:hypothetical protein
MGFISHSVGFIGTGVVFFGGTAVGTRRKVIRTGGKNVFTNIKTI